MKKILLVITLFSGWCWTTTTTTKAEEQKYETYLTAFGGKILNHDNAYVMGVKVGGWLDKYGIILDLSMFGDKKSSAEADTSVKSVTKDGDKDIISEYWASFKGVDTPMNLSLMAAYRLGTDKVQPFIALGPTVSYVKSTNEIYFENDKDANDYSSSTKETSKYLFGATGETGIRIKFLDTKYIGISFDLSARATFMPKTKSWAIDASDQATKKLKNKVVSSVQAGLGLTF